MLKSVVSTRASHARPEDLLRRALRLAARPAALRVLVVPAALLIALGSPAHATPLLPSVGGGADAPQAKAAKTDQLSVRSKKDGSPQLLAGVVTSNNLDQVVVLGQDQKNLGALLVPSYDWLEKEVPKAEWQRDGAVLRSAAVAKLYRQLLDSTLTRENGFRTLERVATFAVLAEPMTIENGLLTPTMKVKRHVVAERYAGVIAELFATRSPDS